jgi:dTDP-4-dehydrorhamnose 3,5-epimerase
LSFPVFPDERGFFREWFKFKELQKIDSTFNVQQANLSKSKKGVIRGVHYSIAPEGQSKLVTCASGNLMDVLIDLRIGSPTYLNIEYLNLDEHSGTAVFIPSGVGHSFVAVSESTSIVYLTSSEYAPKYEKAICPTDHELGIKWPTLKDLDAIISLTDRRAPKLTEALRSGNLPKY